MTELRPEISIVIVSYNVRDLLENCLHSVESALDGLRGEVFVVDNDSDDGSVDMVRQRFPGVKLIDSGENLGFARGNNLALREARGEYLLLLNPDTLVQEDTLHTMLRFFRENEDVGMASCKIIKPDGLIEPACRRSFPSPWVSFTKLAGLSTLFPRSPLFARYNLMYLNEDESYEVDAISGSFMMLRSEVYDAIGGLDESYFMYGEDLDWCFRTQKAGWKLFYVHSTKIIHYGGESTKRSSIDATAEFYKAMQVFASKNLKLSGFSLGMISLGIRLRLALTRSQYILRELRDPAADALTMVIALMGAELLRLGAPFRLPAYAYPTVYVVAVIVMVLSVWAAGSYTKRSYGIVRSALGVLLSFLVISTLTFFFKEWGFSRGINLISTALAMMLIPGRRMLRALLNPQERINPVTGRPTLLVGLNEQSLDVLDRLRKRDERSYDVQGIIDVNRRRIGELVHEVPVVGSVENVGKIIQERRITDIILGPDVLSYGDILSMISRTRGLDVQYRIVPRSMEFIVGKTNVDQLSSVPLLDVEYGLMRPGNRALKRTLDIVVSLPLTVLPYPFLSLFTKTETDGPLRRMLRGMPSVLAGRRSLVGHDEQHTEALPAAWPGKPGLTGLAQLRGGGKLTQEEMLGALLQYVRNYSVFLDIELLARTVLRALSNKTTRK